MWIIWKPKMSNISIYKIQMSKQQRTHTLIHLQQTFSNYKNTTVEKLKKLKTLCNKKAELWHNDDHTMRPIYEYPENFRESLIMPTATFPEFLMGFSSD